MYTHLSLSHLITICVRLRQSQTVAKLPYIRKSHPRRPALRTRTPHRLNERIAAVIRIYIRIFVFAE